MQVLIVEDSPEMQHLLRQIVSSMVSEVECASSGKEARRLLSQRTPGLILLDLGLPDTDGFQFFAELQSMETTKDVPVVFITGRSEVTNKIAAFSLGAEDYIVKPFDPLEVKARLGARLRKLESKEVSSTRIVRGTLDIDVAKQRVHVGTGPERRAVKLTPKEFLLLSHLARGEDIVFSRQQLLDSVWGDKGEVYDRTVDTHISALRRKLGSLGTCLESVPGQGYRFLSQKPPKAA